MQLCSAVFPQTVCDANPGTTNTTIFNKYYFSGVQPNNSELFARVFEHNETNDDQNSGIGYEHAMSYFTNMNQYMQNAINTGSHP